MPRYGRCPAGLSTLTGMSERVVVLPRGINVGGNNRVPMPALRAALTDRGFAEVRTLLASGNIIVTDDGRGPEAVRDAVRETMAAEFGVSVDTVVRTGDEMRAIAAADPLAGIADNGSRYLVTMFSAPLPEDLVRRYADVDDAPNRYVVTPTELYAWAPNGVLELGLTDRSVAREAGCLATARNWNTIGKIVAAL